MTTRAEARQRLDAISAQISTLVRTLAIGVLAIVWLVLSGDKSAAPIFLYLSVWQLVAIAILCLCSIALDLSQYLVGYSQELSAYKSADASTDKISYDKQSWQYSLRESFFWLKQALCLIAAAWLVIALGAALISDLS